VPVGELIESGLTITAIGMGVVFVLLTALVGIIQAMSALAAILQPQTPVVAPGAAPAGAPSDDEVIPVIAAAIAAYRGRHRKQSK
jgi:sodium pump decarboxylase gamma subunit